MSQDSKNRRPARLPANPLGLPKQRHGNNSPPLAVVTRDRYAKSRSLIVSRQVIMSTELDKLDRETARAPSFAPVPAEDDFPLRAPSGSRRMGRMLLWLGAIALVVAGGALVYSRMAHAAP